MTSALEYYLGVSYRRKRVDADLGALAHHFRGRVLDIGGARRRGRFQPPAEARWVVVDLAGACDVRADIVALPFRASAFDAIKATEVLEHVPDPAAALRECARVLTEAMATHTPVALVGSGSKLNIGRPMQTAASVSTRGLRGITLYEPSELVMSARAGTPVSHIEAELAAHGQMLAFEPIDVAPAVGGPQGAQTIGAVFATNLSGARRVQVGAARDHLLGIKAVNGRAELF